MNVCICGGGNLGHVVAGFVATDGRYEVSLLTRHPERWAHRLFVETPSQKLLTGTLKGISNEPAQVVGKADIVLLCLPGFSIREVLMQIAPHIKPGAAVGSVFSSTGFFQQAIDLLPASMPLFGFQRVPFISRTIEYGHRASLLGYKNSLQMAVEHCPEPDALRCTLEKMLKTPVQLLDSYYEACLSNSNPLLHPARLYSLWKDWKEGTVYTRVPLFYEEWTEEAARLYIEMDWELHSLTALLPVRAEMIPTVLEYYESPDAASLAQKLRSIEAFKHIPAPMKTVGGGYVPDFQSRYFIEDFPFGLALIRQLARERGVATPVMDVVHAWGNQFLNNQ